MEQTMTNTCLCLLHAFYHFSSWVVGGGAVFGGEGCGVERCKGIFFLGFLVCLLVFLSIRYYLKKQTTESVRLSVVCMYVFIYSF